VKIDQSFVRSLDCDQNRAHVVRTIVQLATSLGKRVVAEGVETGKECEQLAGMGCDLLQGFLFSKPLPAAMIWPLLHRQLEPQEAQATASAHPPIQRAEPMPPVHALMIGPHDHEPATALRKATSGILLQK
ncbi:MAG TPA: EAL domain-containing protein, partial [Acidobacteriaceae bacterium]